MEPIDLIAKEGLALVNGTAASTAVAAIAIHDCHVLAAASQVLTAFGTFFFFFFFSSRTRGV
jgi:phenylalanine ammonia-lyase